MVARTAKSSQTPAPLIPAALPTRDAPSKSPLPRLTAAAVMAPSVQRTFALQTKANATPQRHARRVPVRAAPIQRAAIIPYETWLRESAKVGRERSRTLKAIDIALMTYEGTLTQKRSKQLDAVKYLDLLLTTWITKKRDKAKSVRLKDAENLHAQVRAKRTELEGVHGSGAHGDDRIRRVYDLYERVRIKVQQIMALPPRDIPAETKQAMTAEFRSRRAFMARIVGRNPAARAIGWAGRTLLSLGEERLAVAPTGRAGRNGRSPALRSLRNFNRWYERSQRFLLSRGDRGDFPDPDLWDKVDAAQRDVMLFSNLAPPQQQEQYFEPGGIFTHATDLVGNVGDMTANIGTGGVTNEGVQLYWREDLPGGEENTAAQNFAKTIMGHFHKEGDSPEAKRDNNIASGVGDIFAAGSMGAQIVAEVLALNDVIKKCNAILAEDPENVKALADRFDARARIVALATAGSVSVVAKIIGGGLTADPARADDASKMFDQGVEGVNMSTDVKIVGQAGDAILGAVNSIKSFIDTVRNILDRAEVVEGDQKTGGEVAMDTFDSIHDIGKTTKNFSNFTGSLLGFKGQIEGGGQVASSSATKELMRGVVNDVPVIPVIGLIVSCLDLVKQTIKLGKSLLAARDAKAKVARVIAHGTETLLDAVTITREAFSKQLNRAIIDILHASASVAAGAMSVSGMGAGIGVAINAVSVSAKLAQVGARKFKQHMRNRKAPDQTNFELAHTEGYDGFHSHTLNRALGRSKSKFNADKSTVNKEMRYNFAALEILRADPDDQKWFLDALGLRRAVKAARNKARGNTVNANKAVHALIVDALKER